MLTRNTIDDRPFPGTTDGPFNLRAGISRGWREAIELAENAYNVIGSHIGNGDVLAMCKLVLGENDFQNKLQQAQSKFSRELFYLSPDCFMKQLTYNNKIATFGRLKSYPKVASQFKPGDQVWENTRSNLDVVIISRKVLQFNVRSYCNYRRSTARILSLTR